MEAVKELMKVKEKDIRKSKIEMADAHCHLYLLDQNTIKQSVDNGVLTMITNSVDTPSNMKNLQIADGKNIFVAAGIDPENAMNIEEDEIKFNIDMIKSNRNRISAIGEIGLDYLKATTKEQIEKQKSVFERFLDLSVELSLPVSIHSRNAISEVLEITKRKGIRRAHIHFFEGDVDDAIEAEKRGYMISIPPLESAKRRRVLKEIAIWNLMAESDSPVAGKLPKDVEFAINMIAEAKGISLENASAITTANTKKFFNIGFHGIRK